MKDIIAAVMILLMVSCGSTPGVPSDDPPDVSGNYSITDTDCYGAFSPTITVYQDGSDLAIVATTDGYNDATGTVNNNGDITVSLGDLGSCAGDYIDGYVIADCTINGSECQVSYY